MCVEFLTDNGKYSINYKDKACKHQQHMTSMELSQYYERLLSQYPSTNHPVFIANQPLKVISIEDPFDQDDIKSWSHFNSTVGNDVQVVGDDLTVTNTRRIKIAADHKACNCLLLKLNQIGTLTEAIERHISLG